MKRTYLPGIALIGALLMIAGWPHATLMLAAGLGTIACTIAWDNRAIDALETRLAVDHERRLSRAWFPWARDVTEWQATADAALAANARRLRAAIAAEYAILADPIAFLTVHGATNDERIVALAATIRTSRTDLRRLHRLARYYGFRVRRSYKDYLR